MSETRERSALDPRDRLAVMVSMAGSYIESGRGDDALAVMRTVAEDVATEIARLTRELEEARERERALREALESVEAGEHIPDRPRVTVTDRGVFQTTPAEILGSRMGREQVEATARLDLTGRGRQEAGGAD